jgi:hypothetical protein
MRQGQRAGCEGPPASPPTGVEITCRVGVADIHSGELLSQPIDDLVEFDLGYTNDEVRAVGIACEIDGGESVLRVLGEF